MTVHSFKNGITVEIPDNTSLDDWAFVKMAMSLILDPPPAAEPKPERKPYTFQRRKQAQRTKLYHKGRKQ